MAPRDIIIEPVTPSSYAPMRLPIPPPNLVTLKYNRHSQT